MKQSHLGTQVSLQAMKALAALAERLPAERVGETIAIFAPLIGREPGRFRHSDDAMVAAFVGVHRAHQTYEREVAEYLARCLMDDGLAPRVIKLAHKPNKSSAFLISSLESIASDGNRWAL